MSTVLEAVVVIGNVALYIWKSGLFENLLSTILGRLALDRVFTKIATSQIVDVSGIVLYLSIISVFVFLTVQVIQKRRWS